MSTSHRVAPALLSVLTALLAVSAWPEPGLTTSVLPRNIVDLIELSENIVHGRVVGVHDGFDARGVPYTEIELAVTETIRGRSQETLTFRQFGLLRPRPMPDGRVNLNVSPDGWPRFTEGEEVLLFLYEPATSTGLRTTVGLSQGKFTRQNGIFRNAVGNLGLFAGTELDPDLPTPQATVRGVDQPERSGAPLLEFVRRAVHEQWIEQRRLRHASP